MSKIDPMIYDTLFRKNGSFDEFDSEDLNILT